MSVDEGVPETMVFTWVDQDRQYFIVTRGSLKEGEAVSRQRWRQVAVDVNADAQMVDLYTHQPVAEDIYYNTFSDVDRKNRRRCNYINSEKKLGTHNGNKCVILSIFGLSFVDTYNVATKSLNYEDNYHVLFYDFGEYMIDNYLDSSPTRPPSKITGRSASSVPVRKRVSAHLFQT